MQKIYHVTSQNEWNKALKQGFYEVESLKTEGFIHCSQQEQVAGVLKRYYQNQTNLLLLHLDISLIKAECKFEMAKNQELFPHIYGVINLDSVVEVEKIS